MNTNYWSVSNSQQIIQYLLGATGYPQLQLLLPSDNDIAATGSTNLLNHDHSPINGMPVVVQAFNNLPHVKVGQRLYIRDYTGNAVGNGQGQCPFQQFADMVIRDLRKLAGTMSGRRLLNSIDNNGGVCTVRIIYGHGLTPNSSQCNPTGGMAAALNAQGAPGAPVSSEVMYNPLFLGVPIIQNLNGRDKVVQRGQWAHPSQKPADVTLFHELMHADDMLRGIFDDTEIRRGTRNVKISELRAVGLDLFDDDGIYSENSYRRERGFVVRNCYTEHTEVTSNGPPVTPEYQRLVTFLNTKLMSHRTFVQSTSHVGKRDKILAVETALKEYNLEHSGKPEVERIPALMKLLEAVLAYKEQRGAKRNVDTLITAIGTHVKTSVEALLNQPTSVANFQALRRISLSLDKLHLTAVGTSLETKITTSMNISFDDRQGQRQQRFNPRGMVEGYSVRRLQPNDMAQLQQQDIADLTLLQQDQTTSPIARQVLAEVIAIAAAQNVTLYDTAAGSSAGLQPGGQGYRVDYGQWNYDDQRLSTLVHELTHVANMQVYSGTPLMVSYDPGLSQQQLGVLLNARTDDIRRLMGLVDDTFTAYQKHWLLNNQDGKLPYAIAAPNPLSLDNLKLAPGGSQGVYNTHVALIGGGMSQVAFEYETVINQVLIYMKLWDIPQTHPLHAEVIRLATVAYGLRAQQRAQQVQQPQNQNPQNQNPQNQNPQNQNQQPQNVPPPRNPPPRIPPVQPRMNPFGPPTGNRVQRSQSDGALIGRNRSKT